MIRLNETREIRASELRIGDTVVIIDARGKIVTDEILRDIVVHEGCRGRHFLVARGNVVCYEPVAFVRILK